MTFFLVIDLVLRIFPFFSHIFRMFTMLNVVYDHFLTRKPPVFTLFILLLKILGGTNAWAVPPPQIFGGDRPPQFPLGLRPCSFPSFPAAATGCITPATTFYDPAGRRSSALERNCRISLALFLDFRMHRLTRSAVARTDGGFLGSQTLAVGQSTRASRSLQFAPTTFAQ